MKNKKKAKKSHVCWKTKEVLYSRSGRWRDCRKESGRKQRRKQQHFKPARNGELAHRVSYRVTVIGILIQFFHYQSGISHIQRLLRGNGFTAMQPSEMR